MKKICFNLLFLLLVATAVAQQRSAKDLEKMFKDIDVTQALTDAQSFQEGSIYRTIILSENTPNLNEIERNLISKYTQVVLMCNMQSKPFQCYFVKDNEDKRGVIGLDGNVIVTPLSGYIHNINNGKDYSILLIGELTMPTEASFLTEISRIITSKEPDILGLFSAVIVDADKSSIHNLIPVGECIFLSLGCTGRGSYDIFNLKVVGEEALWGIVNFKGKEILPNKYTGFIRKSNSLDLYNTGVWGKWVGTTEMDMKEALHYSGNLKADTQKRRMELAQALNSTGEAMINAAITIEETNNQSADIVSNSESESSNDSKNSTNSQEDKYNMSDQRSYNTDKSTYSKYDGMLAQVFAGNREASASEIKDWQSKMKNLRKKWEAKGKSFPHSSNEDR